MARPQTIVELVSADAMEEFRMGKLRRGSNRAFVFAKWPEIHSGLQAGISVKRIWETLEKRKRVPMTYKAFLRNVQACRSAAEKAARVENIKRAAQRITDEQTMGRPKVAVESGPQVSDKPVTKIRGLPDWAIPRVDEPLSRFDPDDHMTRAEILKRVEKDE